MNYLLPLLALLLIAGCGSERDLQKREVEKVEMVTGPLIVDTPIGQFVAQPVRHTTLRSEDTVEREDKRLSMPEVGAIMQAAAPAAGPLGILGTLAGAATTAVASWMAMRRGDEVKKITRQRNEVIEGVETSKATLSTIRLDDTTTAWDALTTDLERKQSRDTIEEIKKRTP